jgi:hypothetical protein
LRSFVIDLKRDFDTAAGFTRAFLKHLLTHARYLLRGRCRQPRRPPVIGSVGFHIQPGGQAMKAVKIIVAVTIAAVLSGCVVVPYGGYYRGGGYYGGGHHHGGGHYRH